MKNLIIYLMFLNIQLIIPEIDKVHNILTSEESYNIEDYNYLTYLCKMMLIQSESINGAFYL